MPVGIIDALEVVDVEHDHADLAPAPPGLAQHMPAQLEEGTPVGQACEVIGPSQRLRLPPRQHQGFFHRLAVTDIGGDFQPYDAPVHPSDRLVATLIPVPVNRILKLPDMNARGLSVRIHQKMIGAETARRGLA